MRWRRLGLLHDAAPLHPKLRSHAANPLAVHLQGDVYRVFFSGRDDANRSSVGYVDVDIVRRECVGRCEEPAFLHGAAGSYYGDGVSIGCCYEADGMRYIAFMGWHVPPQGHWYGQLGRLTMDRELRLAIEGDEPLLALDAADPLSLSYPWVMREDGGYRMWYGSTLAWNAGNGGMLHVVKHATSEDGRHWKRGELAVPYRMGLAQAFTRPTVAPRADGGLDMWFSYRDDIGRTYRIGRATSEDRTTWRLRLHDGGLDVAARGWDCEMVEYPFVLDHGGARYMLYCGNGYGRTGFGLAVMEGSE